METEKQWRKVRWLLFGLLGLALVIALMLLGFLRLPLSAADRVMLREYEAIRSALAHDQLGEARSAALVLASNHEAKQKVADEARVISQSDSLDAARNEFVAMSETAVDLVAHRTGFFVMHCAIQGCPEPCKDCPMDRFGRWVQTSAEVENPFMGLRHLKCGVVDKSL